MFLKPAIVLTCFGILPVIGFAVAPVVDNSKAGADGPHVFYRGKNILVKTIERRDTANFVHTKLYSKREQILLTCSLPETGDRFSFPIKKRLRTENDFYDRPERMLVLSDIEGNFPAFKMMLTGAKVINDNFDWTFGDGHLVLVGDFFDRGLNVTECLWLVYKLESEAEEAGGKVHFILGNHEVMNLAGYYDYVRKKYMENAALIGEDYSLWFDNHSELGRWLRTKNAVEKIGDYVFCHGGISPMLADSGLDISKINEISRAYLGKDDSKILDPLARLVFDTQVGIFWYRSAAKNQITEEEVIRILAAFGAKRMIIGHTLVPEVTVLYGGRVVCVDLYHDENFRRGFMKTLYIENSFLYTLNDKGDKASAFTVVFNKKE